MTTMTLLMPEMVSAPQSSYTCDYWTTYKKNIFPMTTVVHFGPEIDSAPKVVRNGKSHVTIM